MPIDPNWDMSPKLPLDLEASLSELQHEINDEDFKIISNSAGKTKMYILLKDNQKYCDERSYREILSYIIGLKRGYLLHRKSISEVREKTIPKRDSGVKKKLPWE